METREELQRRKQELQRELRKIEAKLLVPSKETIAEESEPLRNWLRITVCWLCVTLVASMLTLPVLPYLTDASRADSYHMYAVAALAGIAGSCISALVSVVSRYAAGLEFSDGSRYPDQEQKERFNDHLVAGFLTRPFLGAATGPLIVLALQAKIFGDVDRSKPEIVLLWSALGGLFAKTLLDKLKDVFANLIGAKK